MTERTSLAGVDVLVTGGAGFVGSHLVHRLLRDGASVTVLAQPGAPMGALEGVRSRIRIVEGELTDATSLMHALADVHSSVVFHLAAWTGGRSRGDDPAAWTQSMRVNLEGTLHLLVALAPRATSIARIVRTGGMEEYGDGAVPYREEQRERAVSPYSASQVAATQAAHPLAIRFGLPLVTVRPSLIYGPGQDASFFLPSLIQACLAGQDFPMTEGTQTCDFVFVEDVVEALVLAAIRDAAIGQIVNAGSGREITVRALAEAVFRQTGGTGRLQLGARADRPGEAPRRFMDVSRSKQLLGWNAKTTLEDGLRRTIEAARADNPPTH